MGAAGSLKEAIAALAVRESLPDGAELTALARETADVIESLPAQSRPRSRSGQAGGLFELPADRPCLVIPDLHARTGFLVDLLGGAWCGERATLEALEEGTLSLLFLGDGFHSEKNGIERWLSAWVDYRAGFPRGNAMRSEMRDGLTVMEIVMRLILAFPQSVAFLKGNHENVRNEEGEGNHPFRKYADEG